MQQRATFLRRDEAARPPTKLIFTAAHVLGGAAMSFDSAGLQLARQFLLDSLSILFFVAAAAKLFSLHFFPLSFSLL
jgi:hypothetical protein